MLLLAGPNDALRIVTDSAALVDVHVSWVDRFNSTDTPGRTLTNITSATTTVVVAAPSASTVRNIRRMRVRNKSASISVTVTTQIFNGTTFELDARVLAPGAALEFNDQAGFFPLPPATATRPWFGLLAGCQGDGDPGRLLAWMQIGSVVSPTPANITATVARCSAFILPFDLTFNRIRAYGVGAVTSTYTVAVYRMSDLARLTASLTFTTAAGAWVSIGSALNVTLSRDVEYFIAVSVNSAVGTTAGPQAMGTTVAAGTGLVAIAPNAMPGNMAQGSNLPNIVDGQLFQFPVTAGAMPTPAAALVAQSAWTGGMPAFFLDASDT